MYEAGVPSPTVRQMELWECALILTKGQTRTGELDPHEMARRRVLAARGLAPKVEVQAMRDEDIPALRMV